MLAELKKCVKNEKKEANIFDIAVYGSLVKSKNKPADIDIVVVFKEGTLKERLGSVQAIKKKITAVLSANVNLDIKGIIWEELFNEAFFARSGILLEGISLFDGKTIAHKLGFKGVVVFTYSLKDKTHTEKVRFNYVLSGRNCEGIVKKLEGKHLAPGVVKIPIKNSLEFESVLEMHNVIFTKVPALLQR